jgi:hypothetical protein
MAKMGGTLPFESVVEKQRGAPRAIARDFRSGMTDVGRQRTGGFVGERRGKQTCTSVRIRQHVRTPVYAAATLG